MAEQDPTVERWLPVVGYEGFYEVSDRGRVRSLRSWKIMRLRTRANGYISVAMKVSGAVEHLLVHRMVLSAFVRHPATGEVCNHIDFDKGNNHVGNLEWTTPAGNSAHCSAAGRMNSPIGERHGASRLTVEDVEAIRRLCETSSQYSVGRLFGISQGHVSQIVTGGRWKSVR